MTIKEAIFERIKTYEYVSFAELTRNIPGFDGKHDYASDSKDHNVIFWSWISNEAIYALEELKKEKKIYAHCCDLFTYFIDGMTLKYPVKKSMNRNKKPMWLPIVFCTFPQQIKRKK